MSAKHVLDGKQQRNATIYQDLRNEMPNKGFDKPWPILRNKWKSLKQRRQGCQMGWFLVDLAVFRLWLGWKLSIPSGNPERRVYRWYVYIALLEMHTTLC